MRARFVLVLALLAAVMLAGCAALAPHDAQSVSASVPTSPPSASTTSAVPPLQFVAGKEFERNGEPPKIGSRLKPGTYKPFMTAADIESVRLGESNLGTFSLIIDLDSTGTEIWHTWTSEHTGESVLVLNRGRVVNAAVVLDPIASGMISLGEFKSVDSLERSLGWRIPGH